MSSILRTTHARRHQFIAAGDVAGDRVYRRDYLQRGRERREERFYGCCGHVLRE